MSYKQASFTMNEALKSAFGYLHFSLEQINLKLKN